MTCGYCAYTYTSRKKSFPAYKRLGKIFSAVIVDEAQLAKSKNTGRGRAVRAINCKGKLILTGTLMKGYITDVYWNVGWILGYNNPLNFVLVFLIPVALDAFIRMPLLSTIPDTLVSMRASQAPEDG